MSYRQHCNVPADKNCQITRAYAALLENRLKSPERVYLFNYSLDDLVLKRAMISAVMDRDKAVAGLYVVRQGNGSFYVGGVVSDPVARSKGQMKALIGRAMFDLTEINGSSVFELDVRVIGGRANEHAFGLFTRLGFQEVSLPSAIKISGSSLDKHLFESAEPDGIHFLALKMRAITLWNVS